MIQHRTATTLRTLLAAAALAAAALLPHGAAAQEAVPARVRVAKATRAGPAHLDPRLEDVKKQVHQLAWQRWELVSDQVVQLLQGQSTFVALPDGSHAALSVVEARGNIVTVEVAMAQKNTQTRVTVEKGQRIVHQVAKEKGGVALFIVVTPWP
ncbi:MAG TPA: hypothetical protein VLT47_05940 [Anaeromyxobacteraceae bacterium]|nr:hypothetical protein [Anaeromyxobacteraceae bacterium]